MCSIAYINRRMITSGGMTRLWVALYNGERHPKRLAIAFLTTAMPSLMDLLYFVAFGLLTLVMPFWFTRACLYFSLFVLPFVRKFVTGFYGWAMQRGGQGGVDVELQWDLGVGRQGTRNGEVVRDLIHNVDTCVMLHQASSTMALEGQRSSASAWELLTTPTAITTTTTPITTGQARTGTSTGM